MDYKVVEENGVMVAKANEFVGGLAEKFEWNADGTKITFTLREGLKFSNGDPLTAEAVKFTYDRIFDQGGVTPFLLSMAAVPDKDHIKVIDDRTIEFTVDKPNTLLLGNMAQFGHSILNPNVVKPHMTADDPYAHEWLKANTAGTEQGPYRLESWEPGNQWVLVRNENYHGEPPKTKRIIFKVIPDPSSRLAQLQSGAVDIAYEIPTLDVMALERNPDIVASGNQEGKETAVYVQQSLAEIGVKVTIQELPGAAFTEKLQKHELGFFFFNNWISINNDPFYHLFWLFRSDCCNYTNYKNDRVWQLIDENTLNTDEAAREQAAHEIQKIIVEEAPWVFLYQPDHLMVMRSNVKGYIYYSPDQFTRYKFLYKE